LVIIYRQMLYLTYQPREDGMGGQFQRVIGIMALAKKYNLTYVHTPIKEMEHLPSPHYLEQIENYFQIKDNYPPSNSIQYDEEYDMEIASEIVITNAKELVARTGKNVLIKIFLPQRILDRDPDCYQLVLPKIREMKQKWLLPYFLPNKTNIAIHIRRGDVNSNDHPTRFTPIEYYYRLVESFNEKFPDSNICIFSEENKENKDEFTIFSKKPQVRVLLNLDILTTFEHLVHADILVTSKSSFSYLAGLLNTNRVVYMDFWHSPLSHWSRLHFT